MNGCGRSVGRKRDLPRHLRLVHEVGVPAEEARSAQPARLQTRSVISSQTLEPVQQYDPPQPEPRARDGIADQLWPSMGLPQTPGQRGSPTKGVVTNQLQPYYHTNPCQTIVEGGGSADGGVADLYNDTSVLQAPGQPQFGPYANPLFQVQVSSESLAGGEVTGYPPPFGPYANSLLQAQVPSESLAEGRVTGHAPPFGFLTSALQAQGVVNNQPQLGYPTNPSFQAIAPGGGLAEGGLTDWYSSSFGHPTSTLQAPAQGGSSVVANPNDSAAFSEGWHETGYSYDY